MVRSLDISLAKLSQIGHRGGVRAFRQEELILGWTLLPEFDSYVVNVFAPVDSALWNFDVYAALSRAELLHQAKFLDEDRRARTAKELLRIIREAGQTKRSDFSSLLLGNWTATPDYFAAWEQSDARLLAHRHRSVLLPAEARSLVTQHFLDQAATFADSCVKPCDDTFALGEVDDLRGTEEWQLLSTALSQLQSQRELDDLLAKVNEFDDERRFGEFADALDLRFGARGCISFWMPPAALISHLALKECAALLEFRLKVALSVCALPQVERLMNEMKSAIDDAESPFSTEFRESMWLALRGRLDPYLDLIAFRF
jgi:hypothetical protein